MPKRSDLISIICRKCDGQTIIVDSRPRSDNTQRRRRQCVKCGARATTTEMYSEDLARIEAKTYDLFLADLDALLRKYGRRN